MPEVFATERRVEFCETDAAGIAHFSAFVCYMEQAEHAFWRHLGTSVVQKAAAGGHLSWPRVHVECDYQGAARFEDVLEITLRVLKLGSKSVNYGFEFMRENQPIATGQIVAVCCKLDLGGALQSVVIPTTLRERLEPFLVH